VSCSGLTSEHPSPEIGRQRVRVGLLLRGRGLVDVPRAGGLRRNLLGALL